MSPRVYRNLDEIFAGEYEGPLLTNYLLTTYEPLTNHVLTTRAPYISLHLAISPYTAAGEYEGLTYAEIKKKV